MVFRRLESDQHAFFNNSYSMGWVIDPFRNEQKVFLGLNSVEYQHPLLQVVDAPADSEDFSSFLMYT